MVGGDLSAADAWTLSLLTNPEVLAVDQHSSGNHPVINTDQTVVWLARSEPSGSGSPKDINKDDHYLAIFNRSESKSAVHYAWQDLGLPGKTYKLRDLWQRKDLGSAAALTATLPPHSCLLYRVSTSGRVSTISAPAQSK
jgi:hypothetical protein